MADVIRRDDPSVAGLRTSFGKLGDALFPSATTQASRRLTRAREQKAYSDIRLNEEKIAKAIRERDAAVALADAVNKGLVDPEQARNFYAQAAIMGPSAMNAIPGFYAGFVGTQPGQQAYRGDDFSNLLVSSGTQSFSGTREGQEEAQRAQDARTAATIQGAAERQARAPVSVGPRSTVHITPQHAENLGFDPGVTTLQGPQAAPAGDAATVQAGTQGPFAGQGQSQQDSNIVFTYNNRRQRGFPTSPEEDLQYSLSYNRLYSPKTEMRMDAQGQLRPVQVAPTIPAGLVPPVQIGQQPATPGAGAQGVPSPQQAAAPPAPGAPTPQPAVAQPVPAGAQPPTVTPTAVQPPAAQATGVPGVTVGAPLTAARPGANKPTEIQLRGQFFAQRMRFGADRMYQLLGWNKDTGAIDPAAYRPDVWDALTTAIRQSSGGLGMPAVLATYAQSPETQQFFAAAQQLLNPILRFDSGAAIPEQEYPRYYAQYIPQAGESEVVIRQKLQFIELSIEAMGRLAERTGLPTETLLNSQVQNNPDLIRQWQEVKAEVEAESGVQLPYWTGTGVAPGRSTVQQSAPQSSIPQQGDAGIPDLFNSQTIQDADAITGFGAQ